MNTVGKPRGAEIILGIDPGSRTTGYGVLAVSAHQEVRYITSGCIRNTDDFLPNRLRYMHEGILTLIQQHAPQTMAIELAFVHRNVSSALKLGQVRGVAMLAASLHGLTIAEYAPRSVKKAVSGYGAANKAQIQNTMQYLLKLSGTPSSDAADALAIAYCHASQLEQRALTSLVES